MSSSGKNVFLNRPDITHAEEMETAFVLFYERTGCIVVNHTENGRIKAILERYVITVEQNDT
jgi:hypothetical protein